MKNLKPIEIPNIPQDYADFAKSVSLLAEQYGVKRFELTFEPDWYKKEYDVNLHNLGTLKVNFSAKDGRGRPSRHLSIQIETKLDWIIQHEPESSN